MVLLSHLRQQISLISRIRFSTGSKFNMNKRRNQSRLEKYKQKLDIPMVSGNFEIYVVCTGCSGYSKTLVIRTDHDRYMFNCGENTIKNFCQVLNAAHATDNIFFTYNSWCNVGGLLGSMMSMTQQIVRSKPLTLHGPPYVEKMLSMSNYFSQMETMNEKILSTFRCRGIEDGVYADDQLTVEYVKLDCQSKAEDQGSDVVGMDTADTEGETTEKVQEKYAVAYIVTPAKPLGSVDKKKLQKLNLKPGPWVKTITQGLTYTFPDGREVRPEDVLQETTSDKRTFVVLECPTADYLDSLLGSDQLLTLSKDPERLPWLIAHMSPAEVVVDSRYTDFMDRFGDDVQHLMMNEKCKAECSSKQLQLQTILNWIHPSIFPLLHNHFTSDSPVQSTSGRIVQAVSGLKYVLRPRSSQGFVWNSSFCFDKDQYVEGWKQSMAGSEKLVEEETKKLKEVTKDLNVTNGEEYPEIVFLGTGSAEPNIRRNASGILLQTRKDEYMLLDCGEGTVAQLYQLYGPEVDKILVNLRAIFISHLHYDHHGGVFNVAEARYKALKALGRDQPLHIIASGRYGDWLRLYRTYINTQYINIRLHLSGQIFELEKSKMETESFKELKTVLNLSKLVSMPVFHTKDSYGIAITHTDGWKLVYSGDTRPCDTLIEHGKDCDILIHEGTFDNSLYEKTIATKHSTTDEAISVGQQMGAKYTLLTHFSQRIQTIPIFTDMFTDNVGFSFDFMKLKPSQLQLVPKFKPLLQVLFAELESDSDGLTSTVETTGKRRHNVEGMESVEGKRVKASTAVK